MKNYDIVVVGGGTAGCATAYIAGKLGLKTLLLEKNIHLGGAISSGLVVPAMNCGENQINTEFFNALIDELKLLGGQISYQGNKGWFNPELTKLALDNLMAKANVDVLFNATITDINKINNHIQSININNRILSVCIDKIEKGTKDLSVPIGARYFVDATGNCDFAKNCGCKFLKHDGEYQPLSMRFIISGIDLNTFGKWLAYFDGNREVTTVENIDGTTHLSTAYTWDKDKNWALAPLFEDAIAKNKLTASDCNYFQLFTIAGMPGSVAMNCPRIIDYDNDFDINNYSKALISGRQSIFRLLNFCKEYFSGFDNAYISNIADMTGIRASMQIEGKYVYTYNDMISGKKFDNPVVISNYPVDVHSKTPTKSVLNKVQEYQLPIESLMSKDIGNLFVAGRCLSADEMAQGALRVQPSCFSMGEGVARYIKTLIDSKE